VLGDRYQITARCGRGGTAVVYRAQDLRLGRDVAVKIIHETLVGDSDYARRFDREARSAARLSHPNIVAIFDQGYDGDRPYIVMEYIGGESLRSVIARQRQLPPLVALRYLDAIARALAAAHEAGLIHRDIKPENVLITPPGEIKVTDFGLAKAASSQTATDSVLMGTLSYLAPELMTTGVATAASDVYSAGIVLYEMLTGQKPHTGAEAANVLYKHVNVDVPPPSEALAGPARERVPDYLDALVTACTSRNPVRRPAQGRALEADVNQVRHRLERGVRSDPSFVTALASRGWISEAETTAVVTPAVSGAAAGLAGPTAPPGVTAAAFDAADAVPTAVVDPAAGGWAAPAVPTSPAADSGAWAAPAGRGDEVTPTLAPVQPPVQPARPLVTIKNEPVYVRRRRGLLALAVLIVLGLAGGGAAWWWVKVGRWAETPTVVGKTHEQAVADLTALGLGAAAHDEYSEDIPLGVVIRSQPEGLEPILKDGTVELWVSLGPERYPMPVVVGLEQAAAEAAIVGGHFAVGPVEPVWSDEVAAGLVIAASEEAEASLKPGSVISLTVSKGPEPIPVPSVVGWEAEQARGELEGLLFVVAVAEEHSREVAAGRVIRQDPAGGVGKHGDAVSLVVSLGPVMITVPEVTDYKRDDAVRTLREAGFNVDVQQSSSLGFRNNRAVATNPEAGYLAPEGSTIVLYVS
jgi:serine/threonine-protein kinase